MGFEPTAPISEGTAVPVQLVMTTSIPLHNDKTDEIVAANSATDIIIAAMAPEVKGKNGIFLRFTEKNLRLGEDFPNQAKKLFPYGGKRVKMTTSFFAQQRRERDDLQQSFHGQRPFDLCRTGHGGAGGEIRDAALPDG